MLKQIVDFILGLGPSIFLPVVMIIIGLVMKMKLKKAIISGITLGIAFTGMGLVLGFMFETISPVATAFVQNTGIELSTVDVGWAPMSSIAWAWPYALLMFPIQIVVNILMLSLKQTNILNVDMWNVWGKIFTATMVVAITKSLALGFVAAIIQIILELKVGELLQKRIQNITNIPGVTCTHYMTLQCIIMAPFNKVLDAIPGIKNTKADAEKLKSKIGVFGENSVMGFIIGGLLAILAGYSINDSLQVAMKIATALVIFPMVAKLFMQSLAPIADSASTFMKSKYKDREIFIGLDWPFLAGQAELWVISIIIVPISLILAVLFSKLGLSTILPLAGIVNVVVVVPAMIISNKNLIKMFILSVIFTPVYLMVSSSFAPAVTELARVVGTINIPTGQTISYYGVEAPIFRWVIANGLAFKWYGILGVIIFSVLFGIFYKQIKKNEGE
ncbi:PTS galactitol transporter subunit IIC [Oceanivirga salmonicida]|uniref:PTS galactitol transporter subunit IIC n=1 Tax=Oceanivirga salmonicida TaxID=1769291 RepID=UPI0012E2888B|nr:PTS transporter subunit IIC [Oceanivirga salmonicida]